MNILTLFNNGVLYMSSELPLFQRYPELKQNLPFISLGNYPTPIQELPGLSANNKVYIKRDDKSGFEYGGNKIRKLEFLLGDAISHGYDEVLTFGCDGSNHALATGIYAKRLGLKSNSILRSQYNAKYVRSNLLKSLYYGIQLYHCENLEEMNALAKKLQDSSVANYNKKIYEIPVGGTSPLGCVGFINAAFELKQQIDDGLLPEPDFVYAAAGTLGTVAGLTIGFDLLGLKTKVISIKVNNANRINVKDYVSLLNDTASLLKNNCKDFPQLKYTENDIHIEDAFFGEDYALFTKECAEAIKIAHDNYDITLDGTYTGKTFAALLNAVSSNEFYNKTFLFWNTLNSQDPFSAATHNNYHELPKEFWKYFQEEVQFLDR